MKYAFDMVHEPSDAELETLEESIGEDAVTLRAFDFYIAALDTLAEAREEGLNPRPFEIEVCERRGEIDRLLGVFV